MAEKTGYTYYADPQQVDFTLRMTVPALANVMPYWKCVIFPNLKTA